LTTVGVAFCLAIVVVMGIGVAIWRGSESLLPLMAECTDERYTATFCTEDQLREANELATPYYGDEAVSSDTAVMWMLRNRKAFVVLRDQSGNICASFGILGLSPSSQEAHARGALLDCELKADDILSFTRTKKSTTLYISGVIVSDARSTAGSRRAIVMVWAMLRYIKQVLGLGLDRDVYAISTTNDSRVFLERFGFVRKADGKKRRDKCDVFHFRLTRETYGKMIDRIGDQSSLCTLKYSTNKVDQGSAIKF
jgi:hypothetical protein